MTECNRQDSDANGPGIRCGLELTGDEPRFTAFVVDSDGRILREADDADFAVTAAETRIP
jgi:hypothetical protein